MPLVLPGYVARGNRQRKNEFRGAVVSYGSAPMQAEMQPQADAHSEKSGKRPAGVVRASDRVLHSATGTLAVGGRCEMGGGMGRVRMDEQLARRARQVGAALKQTPGTVQRIGRSLRRDGDGQFARSLMQLGRSRASRSLSRVIGKVLVTGSILDQYVQTTPTPQNALDIFTGEWASRLPAPLDDLRAGSAHLFEDARLTWAEERLGGFAGRTVLELGPLEGAHTYMLARRGAASITAVEANTRAYLKCLIVKELLDIPQGHFLCGNFVEYLRTNETTFDLAVANGVLYHMPEPVELLARLARATDRLLLWTLYYDEQLLARSPHIARRFAGSSMAEYEGFRYTRHRYEYREALLTESFCGGSSEFSHWLSRDDILGALRHFGLSEIEINFDHPDHPSGPAFALIARRP
jgi:SAM-dependent methyltransferase